MKARLDSTRRGLPICGADTPVSNNQAIRSWLFWGPRSQDPGLCEGDLRSCERMPEGCLAECTLVFPLFIAGGEARDAEHVEIIRERLGMIVDLRRFRNVEACVDVLDEVWRLRASGSRGSDEGKVDWLDIVEHRGWKLAIT